MMGKKATYVIRSRHVSGHERSKGCASSSSGSPAWKAEVSGVATLTGLFSGVGQSQPEGEDDREEDKVRDSLDAGIGGHGYVKRLWLDLL